MTGPMPFEDSNLAVPYLLVGLLGVAVGMLFAGGIVRWIRAGDRAEAIRKLGAELGFRANADGYRALRDRMHGFRPTILEHMELARLANYHEKDDTLFVDVHFPVGLGKHSRTLTCTLVAVELPAPVRAISEVRGDWTIQAAGRWAAGWTHPIQQGWPFQQKGWVEAEGIPAYLERAREAMDEVLRARG